LQLIISTETDPFSGRTVQSHVTKTKIYPTKQGPEFKKIGKYDLIFSNKSLYLVTKLTKDVKKLLFVGYHLPL